MANSTHSLVANDLTFYSLDKNRGYWDELSHFSIFFWLESQLQLYPYFLYSAGLRKNRCIQSLLSLILILPPHPIPQNLLGLCSINFHLFPIALTFLPCLLPFRPETCLDSPVLSYQSGLVLVLLGLLKEYSVPTEFIYKLLYLSVYKCES